MPNKIMPESLVIDIINQTSNPPQSKYLKFRKACCTNAGDFMWYLGHILTIGSLMSLYHSYASIPFIIVGQAITMISRPIGRL
jgi:hypothetical protein